mmetsp:Transcript_53663/g.110774  ORF Transcript_53663/g.110774 Transcript_53663/m.110774 type:complete len:104 (+) Transcript_53663:606-917(+)
MLFLVNTVLSETQRLETMAAQKPVQVNEISAVDATTMPAITKKRLAQARSEGHVPMSSAVKRAVKNGSAAFTVCVNEMWTSETEMLEKSIPPQWKIASPNKRK